MTDDNRHPARIWATVNGARSRLASGKRFLIGGWAEEKSPDRDSSERQYVRADVADEALAALKAMLWRPYGWVEQENARAAIAKLEGGGV